MGHGHTMKAVLRNIPRWENGALYPSGGRSIAESVSGERQHLLWTGARKTMLYPN